jgi:hypothetical protein
MTYGDAAVPTPGGICNDCLNDPTTTRPLYTGSPVLIGYCPHHQAGGFIQCDRPEMRWTIFAPVEEEVWQRFTEEAIYDVMEADHMHLFLDKEDHYCKCHRDHRDQGDPSTQTA